MYSFGDGKALNEHKPIENLPIADDMFLLEDFKKEMKKIPYINDDTRKSINKLRDVDLHLQGEALLDLWKRLLQDAIVFLKSKDSREKFPDQMTLGIDKIHNFLRIFLKFEPILYGAIPNYRDHIAHVFRVLLLGEYLIRGGIGFEKIDLKLPEIPPKKFGLPKLPEISSEEKEAMWCIIALTHDLGMPLQAIHNINQQVRTMLQQFGSVSIQEFGSSYFAQFGNLSDFVLRFVSSDVIPWNNDKLAIHIQPKYYEKFLSALTNFDHGIISSIILMKDLVYFKESDFMMDAFKLPGTEDARQFLIRREILRAITSHSCEEVYYLAITNFAFLLTVCDEMQEWGRPRLVDVTKRGGSETELTIKKFSDELIDYKVSFSFPKGWLPSNDEKKIATKEICNYFISKSRKWANVLRSAVSPSRKLKIRFEVEDKIAKKSYVLDHSDPMNVKISPPELNDAILKGEEVSEKLFRRLFRRQKQS